MLDPVEISGPITHMGSTFIRAFGVMLTLGAAIVLSGMITSARGQARMWTAAPAEVDVAADTSLPEEPTPVGVEVEGPTTVDRSSLRSAIQSTRAAAAEPQGPAAVVVVEPADEAREDDGGEFVAVTGMPGQWLAQIRVAGSGWKTISTGTTRAEAARHAAKAYAKAPTRKGVATLEVRITRA